MAISKHSHYSIRTIDLEATRMFYTEVLGFSVGPRPPFKFPGLWLNLHQVFLDDPSGVVIEINYPGNEKAAA